MIEQRDFTDKHSVGIVNTGLDNNWPEILSPDIETLTFGIEKLTPDIKKFLPDTHQDSVIATSHFEYQVDISILATLSEELTTLRKRKIGLH